MGAALAVGPAGAATPAFRRSANIRTSAYLTPPRADAPLPGEIRPERLDPHLPTIREPTKLVGGKLIKQAYVEVELVDGRRSILLATAVFDGPKLDQPCSLVYSPVVPLGPAPERVPT